MAYFNYRNHKIFYEEIGSGSPLLLLHGNTASSRMFAGIAEKFAQNYRVILLDFLGCGRSERVCELAQDLWFDEAMQAICLLDEKGYCNVNVIGSSGGALAAINVAFERPDLVGKLIADSFEGERALPDITENLRAGREASKLDSGARAFYEMMNGADWEQVVDADTKAVLAHAEHIGNFFHKPLSRLKPDVLLTGSNGDEFCTDGFFDSLFTGMIHQIGHGEQHIFENGGHPAMLSNQDEFVSVSSEFFAKAT